MAETVTLVVNGAQHNVQAEADTPLLYILRNDLKLKGPKFGCGQGYCGACMVLLDGHAVNACDTPLWAAAEKQVTTVEGLGTRESPSPLQHAFIAEQAVQCGYCISGCLMSAAALLKRNAHPTENEIKAALARNLCRCGTHARIIKAIQRAAAENDA